MSLGLGGCTNVPRSTYKESLDFPEDVRPVPIRFSKLRNTLPPGLDVGTLRPGTLFTRVKLGRDAFRGLPRQDMEDALAEIMEMQGYDIGAV